MKYLTTPCTNCRWADDHHDHRKLIFFFDSQKITMLPCGDALYEIISYLDIYSLKTTLTVSKDFSTEAIKLVKKLKLRDTKFVESYDKIILLSITGAPIPENYYDHYMYIGCSRYDYKVIISTIGIFITDNEGELLIGHKDKSTGYNPSIKLSTPEELLKYHSFVTVDKNQKYIICSRGMLDKHTHLCLTNKIEYLSDVIAPKITINDLVTIECYSIKKLTKESAIIACKDIIYVFDKNGMNTWPVTEIMPMSEYVKGIFKN